MTSEVFQLARPSTLVREEQSLKVLERVVTFEVSQPERSRVVREEQL